MWISVLELYHNTCDPMFTSAQNYIRLWDKKMRCHWEHLREQIGNLGNILITWWEQLENLMGTKWEQKRKETNPPLEPSHWLHEISISKMVCHHFQPGLYYPNYKLRILICLAYHGKDIVFRFIIEYSSLRDFYRPLGNNNNNNNNNRSILMWGYLKDNISASAETWDYLLTEI